MPPYDQLVTWNNLTSLISLKTQDVWNEKWKSRAPPSPISIKVKFYGKNSLNNLSGQDQVAMSRTRIDYVIFIHSYLLNKKDAPICPPCNYNAIINTNHLTLHGYIWKIIWSIPKKYHNSQTFKAISKNCNVSDQLWWLMRLYANNTHACTHERDLNSLKFEVFIWFIIWTSISVPLRNFA